MFNSFCKILIVSTCFVALGCTESAVSISGFLSNPDNGYSTSTINGKRLLSLTRIPAEVLISENYSQEEIGDEYDDIKDEYNRMIHFKLELEALENSTDIKAPEILGSIDKEELLDFLSFEFNRSVLLMAGSDTISCSYVHLVKEFDASKKAQVNLGFVRPESSDDSIHIIGDLAKIGGTQFEFTMPLSPTPFPNHLIQ